jgi:GntR family transcriptional regulator, arabinose operon transcriptional repressor
MAEQEVRKPKHRKIFEHIHQAIEAGQFKAGYRLPSEAALCRRFETSRPTVARAMRDLETAGFVERRPGSGTYIRIPKDIQTKMFGLLIPGLGNTEIFEPICAEIARAMQAHNYTLLWGNSSGVNPEDNERMTKQLCEQYIADRVSGVFFAPMELSPHREATNREVAERLHRSGIPVVLLDRDLETYPARSNFDLIGIDNRRAGHLLTDHLLRLGRRNIHFMARPASAPTVEMRIAGWLDALAAAGIPRKKDWLHFGEPSDLEFIRGLFLDSRPDAIVCANDNTAAKLMQSLLALDIRIPDDVSVVGCDDVKYASLLPSPLTTLRQPCREIGASAVAMMLHRIENRSLPARDGLLNCKLIVRESCGATKKLSKRQAIAGALPRLGGSSDG